MDQWQKNLYVLWAGTLIAAISFSFISPFLPIFLGEMEVGDNLEMWSGLLYSGAFLSSCLLSPVWGSMADKYGRKVMIMRAGLGMGLINIITAFAQTPMHLLILRLLNGVVGGFIPSAIALVATNTPEDKLGTSLGLLRTGSAAGSVLGPLVGGAAASLLGIRQTFMAAGITLWVATLVVIFGVKEVAKPLGKSAKINVIGDLRTAWSIPDFRVLMLFVTLTNASVMALSPILTPFIMRMTASDASMTTGIVFSVTGIATVLAAPKWGVEGAKTGFKTTLQISLLASGLLNLPQVLAGNVFAFGALRFLYGLAYAGSAVSIDGLTSKVVSPEFRGRAFGISQSFSQLGAVIGPMIGGFLASWVGYSWVFIITGVSLLMLAGGVRAMLGRSENLAIHGPVRDSVSQ